MEQKYYFKKVTARKSCYCSQCDINIEKGSAKFLVYVEDPSQTEYHYNDKKDKNGEPLVDKIMYLTLIGITHEECFEAFKEKNKEEHSTLYSDKSNLNKLT